jgi:hypothetical protein
MTLPRLRSSVWFGVLLLLGGSCSRHADLIDDSNGGIDLGPTNPFDEAALVDLEVPFDEPPFASCEERPEGACVGVNDFPCDFTGWFNRAADDCQNRTGCRANGWVVGDMGADGCVTRLRMSEPSQEFAACLTEVLGGYRCPCGAESRRRFLGIDNVPCAPGERPCGPSEFPCPSGQVCRNDVCVLESEAGGGPG